MPSRLMLSFLLLASLAPAQTTHVVSGGGGALQLAINAASPGDILDVMRATNPPSAPSRTRNTSIADRSADSSTSWFGSRASPAANAPSHQTPPRGRAVTSSRLAAGDEVVDGAEGVELLAELSAAAVQRRTALGERTGERDQLPGRGTRDEPFAKGPLCAELDGIRCTRRCGSKPGTGIGWSTCAGMRCVGRWRRSGWCSWRTGGPQGAAELEPNRLAPRLPVLPQAPRKR